METKLSSSWLATECDNSMRPRMPRITSLGEFDIQQNMISAWNMISNLMLTYHTIFALLAEKFVARHKNHYVQVLLCLRNYPTH